MSKKNNFDPSSAFRSIAGIDAKEAPENKGGSNQDMTQPPVNAKSEKMNFVVSGKREPKTARVNLLLKPSVYEAARKKCNILGVSLNECIGQLLEQWGSEK